MPELTEYRITFGIRYADETHPRFPEAHPDGWVAVMAENEDAARRLVHDRIGNDWAFIYHPAHPNYPGPFGRHFRKGELARWSTWNPVEVIDWPEQVASLQAQVAAALAIHSPAEWVGVKDPKYWCAVCLDDEEPIPYPCPTAQALGVPA